MKARIIVAVAVAAVMIGGSPAAFAQSESSVSQSQFNSALDGPFSFSWWIDSSIFFTTNGQTSYGSGSPLEYGTSSATWNISISFNSALGNASVTATTGYLSPVYNWTMNNPIGSTEPITSLILGNTYQATNDESMTISGITLNEGIPVSGTLTVDDGQGFSGLLISDDDTPINSLSYTLTVDTSSTWQFLDDSGGPALFNEVAIPGVNSVPEPASCSMIGIGLLAIIYAKKFRKK